MTEVDNGDKQAVEVNAGYKMAVEVLVPLNHNRYKDYFTQFIVLHFGLFTLMKVDMPPDILFKVPILSAVGVILSFIWLLTLMKIRSDISKLWKLIEDYEDEKYKDEKPKAYIKTHESRSDFYSSGSLMISVPIIIGLVYLGMLVLPMLNHLIKEIGRAF